MSELYIKGKWNIKEKKVSKPFSPMIGAIYLADNITGVLVEDLGETVVLRTKDGEYIKVLKEHLKSIVNE